MAERYSTAIKRVDNYVVIDTETTGISADKHELIEVAAAKVENGIVIDTFQTLIRPRSPISEEITGITGITDEMVKDAPLAGDVMPGFLEFLGELPIIGHNVTFDARFISAASGTRLENDLIDTMRISKSVAPLDNNKLGTVYDYCVGCGMPPVDDGGRAHRALHDVMMTQAVYEYLKPQIVKEVKASKSRKRPARAVEVRVEVEAEPIEEKQKKPIPKWAKVIAAIVILYIIAELFT